MENHQLRQYVREQRLAGVEDQDIRKALLANGWRERDVDMVMNEKAQPAWTRSRSLPTRDRRSGMRPGTHNLDETTPSTGTHFVDGTQPAGLSDSHMGAAQNHQDYGSGGLVEQNNPGGINGDGQVNEFGERLIGFGELLSRSMGMLGKLWLRLLGVQVLGWLPLLGVGIVVAIVVVVTLGGIYSLDSGDPFAAIESFLGAGAVILFVVAFVALVAMVVVQIWSAVAMYKVIGYNLGVIEAYKRSWGKQLLRYWWVMVLEMFIIFGGMMVFFFPAIIFMVWFGFSAYVAVLEDQGGMKAINRSLYYVRGHSWDVFLRWLGLGLLVIGAYMGVAFVSGIFIGIAEGVGSATENELSGGIISMILQFGINLLGYVVGYFMMIAGYILYRNLRELKGEPHEADLKTRWWQIGAAILGLLFPLAIIAVAVLGAIDPVKQINKARDASLLLTTTEVVTELDQIYLDQGVFPADINDFEALGDQDVDVVDRFTYQVDDGRAGYQLCVIKMDDDEICVTEEDTSELESWSDDSFSTYEKDTESDFQFESEMDGGSDGYVNSTLEQRDRAADIAHLQFVSQVTAALYLEYAESGVFPETLDGLEVNNTSADWDSLEYEVVDNGNDYRLCTMFIEAGEVCVTSADQGELYDKVMGEAV